MAFLVACGGKNLPTLADALEPHGGGGEAHGCPEILALKSPVRVTKSARIEV